MTVRIAVIVGTRPEIIKMAPVYRRLVSNRAFDVSLVSTGQHREMSRQAFEAFEISPSTELDLMTDGQTLGQFASRALDSLSRFLEDSKPDVVLVQGDTTTTLAASLAAFYLKIRVGHVEAGMRTGNIYSPWPEEMNRRLTAPLSSWHFVPVERNRDHLVKEGIPADRCFLTGNTVLDSLLWMRDKLAQQPTDRIGLLKRLKATPEFLDRYLIERSAPLILVTGHRRESHGQGVQNLCVAIKQLVTQFPDLGVLFPVHPNPQVRNVVHQHLANFDRVVLSEPLDYGDFVWVMDRCYAIISDSGGIQGEAISLNKPVLVTRDTTEYPEAVECGGCQLVGTESSTIFSVAAKLLTDQTDYQRRSSVQNPYGDGLASEKIAGILERQLTSA